MNELWNQLAAAANLNLSEAQHALLDRYLDLLLAANATMNLTRIDDRPSAEIGHVGDSLTLLPFLPPGPLSLVDVGSGGGVPGIPLAIARPDATVTLVESTQKKAAFLSRCAAELGLASMTVFADRVEVLAHGDRRDSFDVATARAVGAMNPLVEWCLPLVKKGGVFLAMKGAKIAEELPAAEKAIKLLNGAAPVVYPVALPGTERHVVVAIAKLGRTNPRYPRPAAQLKRNPL